MSTLEHYRLEAFRGSIFLFNFGQAWNREYREGDDQPRRTVVQGGAQKPQGCGSWSEVSFYQIYLSQKCHLVAVRRLLSSEIGGMTLDAFETPRRFVVVVQLLTEHFLMATRRRTRGKDWNIRFETSQCPGFRDVDVADSAFGWWDSMAVFLAAALVPPLH